jgi:hypothetical protein
MLMKKNLTVYLDNLQAQYRMALSDYDSANSKDSNKLLRIRWSLANCMKKITEIIESDD